MSIYISHGASGDWFVVKPLEGKTEESMAGTPITNKMAVDSLLNAGRTVYRIKDLELFSGTLKNLFGELA